MEIESQIYSHAAAVDGGAQLDGFERDFEHIWGKPIDLKGIFLFRN